MSKGSYEYSDIVSETETEVEVDWLDAYDQYVKHYNEVFDTGSPHDLIFRSLVHGSSQIPCRNDVVCLLHVSQGEQEEAIQRLPLGRHALKCVLEMACLEGYIQVVNVVLSHSERSDILPKHLQLAAGGDHIGVAQALLDTDELTQLDVAMIAEDGDTYSTEMQQLLHRHLMSTNWCSVM